MTIFKVGNNILGVSGARLTTADGVPELLWDANAATAGQTNGAGAWLGADQWWNGTGNQAWVTKAKAVFGGPSTAGGAVTLASPTTVHNFTFKTFTGTYTLGTIAQAITLRYGIDKRMGSGIVSFLSPIILEANQTWYNNSITDLVATSTAGLDTNGKTLTIFVNSTPHSANTTGRVDLYPTGFGGIFGAGGIIKKGKGVLKLGNSTLTNVHTYSGPTILDGGVIHVSGVNVPLGNSNLEIRNGILEFYWNATYSPTLGTGAGQIQITGGTSGFGMQGSAGVTVNFAGGELVWGSAYFNPNVLALNSEYCNVNSTATSTLQNAIDLAGATRTITVQRNLTSTSGSIGVLSGVIRTSSGTAGIIKEGHGLLRLSANNTFNGGIVLNAGTLDISNNATQSISGDITVNSGAEGFFVSGGAVVTNNVTLNTGEGFRLGTYAGGTISGAVTGSSSLIVPGPVGLGGGAAINLTNTANAITGQITIQPTANGIYVLSVASLPDSAGKIILPVNAAVISNLQFIVNAAAVAPITFSSRQFELQGSASGQTIILSNLSAQAFTINTDLSTSLGSGAKTLTLQGTGAGLSTFNGAISNGGFSTLNLLKSETGIWVLGGTNTYTGTTTVSNGTIRIGNGATSGSISNSASIVTTSPGILAFNRSDDVVQGADFANTISGTGAVSQNGAGVLVLSGINTYTGNTTANAGTIRLDSFTAIANSVLNTAGVGVFSLNAGVGSYTIGGLTGSDALAADITVNPTHLTGLILNVPSGLTRIYTGVIADLSTGMSVTKTGLGTQSFVGGAASTFTGGFFINQGIVIYDSASSASIWGDASNVITFTGSAELQNSNNAYTLARDVIVNSGVTATFSGAFGESTNITGIVSGAGDLHIKGFSNGWVLTLSNNNNTLSGLVWLCDGIASNATLVVNSLTDGADTTKRLKLGSGGALADFNLQGSSVTPIVWTNRGVELAGTTGACSIDNNSSNVARTLTIVPALLFTTASSGNKTLTLGGTNTGANTFSGVIANNGASTTAITKDGSGTWVLSNTNTYTGATTLSAGILRITGSIASSAVTVTVGTLEGSNTDGGSATTGAVTVASIATAIVRPGSFGNNTLNTGVFTFSGTLARLTIDSTTSTMSKIAVTGDVALGACDVIFNAGITTNGTYKIITATGTMNGTLPNIITNSTGKTIVLQQTGNDLEAVVS